MSAPYHVQVYVDNGVISRGFFYAEGNEFRAVLEKEDETLVECGNWPNISAADTAIRNHQTKAPEDPLYRWRQYHLFVAKDGNQYSIIFATPSDKWGDTGLRYSDYEYALSLVRNQPS